MRTTASRLPISIPATTLRDYNRVVATGIHIMTDLDGKVSLSVRYDAADAGGKILVGHQFRVELDDVKEHEIISPRLVQALDNLNGILGRFYRLQHINSERKRIDSDDPKQGSLRVERDAAWSDIRQPVATNR